MKSLHKKILVCATFTLLFCLIAAVSVSGYYDDENQIVQSGEIAPQNLFYYDYDYISSNNGLIIYGFNYPYELEGELIIPSEINGQPVNTINLEAFDGCKKITSLVVSEGIKYIEGKAFSGCGSIASITLPESLVYVSQNAFEGTEWYEAQPDGVLYCSDIAFGYKGTMYYGEDIVIKEGTKKISSMAFSSCEELSFVDITEGVTYIGEKAFSGCSSIEEIVLPISLAYIGEDAFSGCSSIKKVNYRGTPTQWNKIDIDGSFGYYDYLMENISYHYGTPHTTVTTTKKATLKANGKIVTKCKVCGVTTKNVTIRKPKTIKLESEKYICTAKAIKPVVIVKNTKGSLLKENTDYTISYPKGTDVPGKYKVKITFKGKYSGTKNISFMVVPDKPQKLTAKADGTSVVLKWSKVIGATGYTIYMYDNKSDAFYEENYKKKTVNTTSCEFVDLLEKKEYTFKVKAYYKKNKKTYSSDASTVKVKTTKAKFIDLPFVELGLCVGESYTLKPKTYPKNAKVKWKTSKKSVVKVSSKGKITGLKQGKATITAFFKSGDKTYKDTCVVRVSKPSIEISDTYVELSCYDTVTLKCYTNPDNVDVKWSSNNASVADVDSNGVVYPMMDTGNAIITASFTYNGKKYKAQCNVKVFEQSVITISNVSVELDYYGGVKPRITIVNNSYDDIKYITLDLEFRNKFGDPAYCEINNNYKESVYIESGLYGRTTKTFYTDPVIYNKQVHRIDIKTAKITYVDNRTETLKLNYIWKSPEYYY